MSYRDLFERLNEAGIRYVVPRKYDRLPERTIDADGDVDVVLEPDQFREGVAACEAAGFSLRDDGRDSRLRLVWRAVRDPGTAIRALDRDPKGVVRALVAGERAGEGNPRHENEKLYRGSQMVDLRNNLAYRSPMDGSRIPVHPSVTEGMLARRRERDPFYAPAPSDELAHLVPHCVFDKDGEFPPYYVDRCETLLETVRSDPDRLALFEDLLGRIFFEADDLVFDLLVDGRYSEIREELRRFSEY